MDQEIKQEFKSLSQQIETLAQVVKEGFNRMELRLGNTAYTFEVRELDKRLIKVERKLGLEA